MGNEQEGATDQDWRVDFDLNGRGVSLSVSPLTSLAEILRDYLGLRGTKVACNSGECGACTVLMDGEPVNACLVLAPQLEGAQVVTIEGLESDRQLAQVQEAFLRHGAVQCGYCSPGIVMSAVALLNRNHYPTKQEIEQSIAGNLCRCTGYQKIVEAIESCSGVDSQIGADR